MELSYNDKTVWVLGAGSNQEYGFPLGNELKSQIVKSLSQENDKDILVEAGIPKVQIQDFIETLNRTTHKTIDQLIGVKQNLTKIATYAIKKLLLEVERRNAEMLFDATKTYARMFEILNHKEFNPSNLSIITFNYDRSLEYFFDKYIHYNYSDADANRINRIVMMVQKQHVYGDLGDRNLVAYGANPNNKTVFSAEKQLLGFAETIPEVVKQIIKAATKLIFIGFGYHEQIMREMFNGTCPRTTICYGTSHALTEHQKTIATSALFRVDFLGAEYQAALLLKKLYLE